ncbi:MAG: amidase, partial [Syntrophomonadaceae bacterium]|nr:amidase [Syntrophomonadaceae bacterium]
VVGFKSGNRQVSQEGSFPPVINPLQEQMLGIGAMAKSVRDARMINEIIAYEVPEPRALESFTINILLDSLQYPANPITLNILSEIKKVLAQDFNIIDEKPPGYNEAAPLWQIIMSINGAKEAAQLAFGPKPVKPLKEFLKEICFNSSELHRNMTRVLVTANMMKPSLKTLQKVERTIAEGNKQVADYLDKKLLIMPVYHRPAPPHGTVIREVFSPLMTFKRYMPFIAYANTWGLPALIVPVGEDNHGLPIGIQIVSKVGNEDAIFQIGEIIESKFRGYKRKVL